MTDKTYLTSCIDLARSKTEDPLKVAYTSHDGWPNSSSAGAAEHGPIEISVFDSSFNPPTLAHLSLALLQNPLHPPRPFDAHLLLLSVTNADKTLKPGDANYEQRLEMMILLAQDMQTMQEHVPVAVAVIDEPTYVGKSTQILQVLRKTSVPSSRQACHRLHFIVGYDTLIRLFAARYYSSEDAMQSSLHHFFSEEGEDSFVICARRAVSASAPDNEESVFFQRQDVRRYLETGKLVMVDIGERAEYSSTAIRESVRRGDGKWHGMCHQSVIDYINQAGLYQTEP